jgi:D-sedoheptulose 7-phosphate isomerase
MASDEVNAIARYLEESRDVVQATLDDPEFLEVAEAIASAVTSCLQQQGKLLIAGNGGSAADAQHIAGEFISRLNYDRPPTAAIALTTDSSVLTAVGNDYGYDQVFERQVLGLGRSGDVFLAISTSGRSPNILKAMEAARKLDMVVVGFTGRSGGQMSSYAHLLLRAPSDLTPLIQQVHIVAAHVICGRVEERLFPGG